VRCSPTTRFARPQQASQGDEDVNTQPLRLVVREPLEDREGLFSTEIPELVFTAAFGFAQQADDGRPDPSHGDARRASGTIDYSAARLSSARVGTTAPPRGLLG
jgi:hypothetical protein